MDGLAAVTEGASRFIGTSRAKGKPRRESATLSAAGLAALRARQRAQLAFTRHAAAWRPIVEAGIGSAGRFAAARAVDLFLERVQADRADEDIVANDVAGRAVEAERLGELEVFLDRGLDLVARHVLLDPRDVETDLLGGRECARQVRLAAPAEQLLMEFEIFLAAGLVLHAHGRRNLRCLDRTLAQHRKLLEHEFELAVVLHEIEHVAHRPFAVAAIVIEELDHGDVALGIAQRHLAWRGEKRGAVLLDAGAMLFRLGHLLPLVELVHHVLQQRGMAQQIVLGDALDLAALRVAEGLRLRGNGRQGQQDRKQRGDTWAHIKSHHRSSFCHRERKALGGGLRLARSSALTQPGEPTGKRVLARAAISRAVLRSPRTKAAWAEARSARARSFFWP